MTRKKRLGIQQEKKPDVISAKEAAEILQRTQSAVSYAIRKGYLTAEKYYRSTLLRREDVQSYARTRRKVGRPMKLRPQ